MLSGVCLAGLPEGDDALLDIRSSHFLPCVVLASIFEVKSYYFHFLDKGSKAQND